MKTRIITGAAGVLALGVVVFLLPRLVLGVVVGALAAIGVIEYFHCTIPELEMRIPILTAVFAAVIPISAALENGVLIGQGALFLLLTYLFAELMLSFRAEQPYGYEVVCLGVLAGFVFPWCLASLVRLAAMGKAFVLLPFLTAFASDSFAYFSGVYLGRHKLVPRLSPKKTVEALWGAFWAPWRCCCSMASCCGRCILRSGSACWPSTASWAAWPASSGI
jgi:phosphatidate cytidylyltransferase